MSDTQVTPESEVQAEVLETVTTPEVAKEAPKGDRSNGAPRKGAPRRDG